MRQIRSRRFSPINSALLDHSDVCVMVTRHETEASWQAADMLRTTTRRARM